MGSRREAAPCEVTRKERELSLTFLAYCCRVLFVRTWCGLSTKGPDGSQLQVEVCSVSLVARRGVAMQETERSRGQHPLVRLVGSTHKDQDRAVGSTHS